jgi:16S rRNA processing protein RimM
VLRNRLIYTAVTELPALPAGENYHHQLIGLRVVKQSGEFLGILEEIIQTGAKDVYSITTSEGSEILIPAVEDFFLEISLERHEIIVAPPEWE